MNTVKIIHLFWQKKSSNLYALLANSATNKTVGGTLTPIGTKPHDQSINHLLKLANTI
jgi:hypothetical protein